MSIAKKKSFDRFVRLAPPRFGDTSRDKTYDFLTKCPERLFNLGLAKEWWRSVLSCRSVGSPTMGWGAATEVFLERFVPYNLRDQRRDKFNTLESGSLSVSEYVGCFHEFSRYFMSSIPTEFDL
ncbi:hypothetical protein KY284_007978 [Solanum tuberosum]|nr:hypothetical protein KY284_007978 [Solanum tuberosum]